MRDHCHGAGSDGIIRRGIAEKMSGRESNAPNLMGGDADCNMALVALFPPPDDTTPSKSTKEITDSEIHRSIFLFG